MLHSSDLRQYGLATALTAQLSALVVVGVLAGNELDARFDSKPWAMLVLTLLGFGLGLFVFAKGISTENDDESEPR